MPRHPVDTSKFVKRPPMPSHLDNWAAKKKADPEGWAKEWAEAKEWYEKEYKGLDAKK